MSNDNNLSQPNCSGAAARGSASNHFQLDSKSPNIGNSMFSASEMTQSDTISHIAGITQTNPGSVYRCSHGTAKTTLTSAQLPKRLEGPSTTYVPEWPSSEASTSDGFHQTCIMSPSLYTGGTPLVTNFPMSEHSSQLVAIGQSLPLLPQKLVQQIQVGEIVDFGELPSAKRKTASSAHNVHLPDSTCTVTGSTYPNTEG